MKITPITLFLMFFSVSMIILILSRMKRETIGLRSSLVWILLWSSIGFFSLFPDLLNWATRLAQMEFRIFFVLLVAIFVLFALVFNLSTKLDQMQRNWEKLVQELALTNYKIDKNKEKEKL
jgi:hypothetical protein